MGTVVIRIPDIGEGIAEVELVAWYVAPGDALVEDQPVAEVMTDKATVEIPCHVHGKVIQLGGAVGDTLAVGAELLRIEVAEGDDDNREVIAKPQVAGATPATVPVNASTPAAVLSHSTEEIDRDPELSHGGPSSPIHARESEHPPTSRSAPRRTTERPLASPAVRRRALDQGIDLRPIAGSGPAGRILADDLDDFMAHGEQHAPGGAGGYARREGEQTIAVMGLRRRIAQNMQEAKRRIPHFAYVEEVDVTELEQLRQRLNAEHAARRGKLTLLPFLTRALVLAVREVPQVNARFDDEADVVTRHAAVHLGVATQTDQGLMVPVLRHAEALDVWATAKAITQIAEAARSGQAARDDLSGSTITITSLGALGGLVSTPIINRPEVAIVGVNRIVERPMLQGGQVVARQLMNLSSSFDHRVVDGMDAARFIQAMRKRLETPALLFAE